MRNSLLAVDPAEIAVPADGDDIGKEHAVLQGQECKVDGLDKGPDHPVGLEGGPPGFLEALLGGGALHGGHAAEEDANHGGGEDGLVDEDAGEGLDALVGEGDAAGEEVEPGSGGRAKDDFFRVTLVFFASICCSAKTGQTHHLRKGPCGRCAQSRACQDRAGRRAAGR